MKGAIVVCFLALAAVALARPNDEQYTDRWDSINVHEIVENDVLLNSYMKCMLDMGKCTPEAKELKSNMKDAIETDCAKCTGPQREGTKVVIAHLVNHKPDMWKQLTAKYDPTGKASARYEKELKEIKH